MNTIDLFAGPGGWDLAAEALGFQPLGIEWDKAACQTREAAGLWTLQADVGELDPHGVMRNHFPLGPSLLDGLIASPPCQAFSMAGKGEGRQAIDLYADAAHRMSAHEPVEWTAISAKCGDQRAHLVLEPLRWALALRPQWVALEQVTPVLPVWEATASALREHGYQTWTGVLSAEQYGVPQTRKRAVLLAHADRPVTAPAATHARYVAPRRQQEQTIGLFDAPDPDRITPPEDRDLQPWVSMAEALGWGMTARPYPVIASGRTTGGPDKEKVGGSTARAAIYDEQAAGRWLRASFSDEGTAKPVPRGLDEPAATVTGKHRSAEWTADRSATTVAGDPRIAEPGWRGAPRDYAEDGTYIGKRSMDNAVRVSVEEAAVLQSFPTGYPWQGTRSKIFEQIGNAIPPLLACAVLHVVLAEEPADSDQEMLAGEDRFAVGELQRFAVRDAKLLDVAGRDGAEGSDGSGHDREHDAPPAGSNPEPATRQPATHEEQAA